MMNSLMQISMKFKAADLIISVLFASVISFFAEIWAFLLVVGVLVVVDLFTGVAAAKSRMELVRSNKLRRSVKKLVFYMLAIMISEGFRLVFFDWAIDSQTMVNVVTQYIPITYITAFMIAWVELKSNIENIEEITGVKIWESIEKRFKGK